MAQFQAMTYYYSQQYYMILTILFPGYNAIT